MTKYHWVLFGLVLVLLLLAACSPAAQPASGGSADGKALVEQRCVNCHDMGKIEAAKKKSADEWRETVDRMIAKGAQLSAEEKEVVVKYLAETYK